MNELNKFLHVCITYTEDFKHLSKYCCSTLNHKDIIIHLNKTTLNTKYEGFRSVGWFECLKNKILFLNKILIDLPYNSIIASIDCDIHFLNLQKFINLKQVLYESDFECFGQAEDWINRTGLNGGFLIFKKTNLIMELIDNLIIQDYSTQFLGDQEFLNHFINKLNIKYFLLDPKEYMHGGPIVNKTDGYPDKNNIVMHHATWTSDPDTLKCKKEQINYVRNVCGFENINWNDINSIKMTNKNISYYFDGDKK